MDSNKKQRHIEIKGNMLEEAGQLRYEEYPLSFEGLIQASLAAFPTFDT